MQSWKAPALLAMLGLGSLLAQGTPIPGLEQTDQIVSDHALNEAPLASPPPVTDYVGVEGGTVAAPLSFIPESGNVASHSGATCSGCATCSTAEPVVNQVVADMQYSEQYTYAPAPMVSSQSCDGCSSGCSSCRSHRGSNRHRAHRGNRQCCGNSDGVVGGYDSSFYAGTGSYDASFPGDYTMGSGSGVASGVISPNANSGGLHTRYPYYNYRHPWFYQGPPSQNVTIVW